MSSWLDPLRRALDEAESPAEFFFRDDDAGWRDDRLFALLDLFAAHGAPIDLAVIPSALTQGLAAALLGRAGRSPGRVEVHQHGFAHVNHETEGRKCEFGPSRAKDRQRRDIAAGRDRLRDMLGPSARPVFTPPWNRCTAATGECLVELGFRALSRDATAGPLGVPGLAEVPVRVDWFKKRKGARLGREAWGALLADEVRGGGRVGVMLHHAEMDEGELEALGELLAAIGGDGRAALRPMLAAD
jgi:peptidoglycan/xylan/chitin deacetylase (PgdA/CDA1 family)